MIKKKKEVVVLGSGMSILEFSPQEIDYINNCEAIIAINKFMAFYQKSRILPTHIYFVDNYEPSTKKFLQYVFDVCRKDNLKKLTFILNKSLLSDLNSRSCKLTSDFYYYHFKRLYWQIKYGKISKYFDLFLTPKDCNFEFISHEDWLKYDQSWAQNLNETLFHYRGSLSTVLNYISIQYPNYNIRLAGVDFNSPQYFFQQELEELDFEWQDWTTSIVKEKKIHFSAIPHEGTTMFDKFEFILEQLHASGNFLYSCNKRSLLVEKKLVEYNPLV